MRAQNSSHPLAHARAATQIPGATNDATVKQVRGSKIICNTPGESPAVGFSVTQLNLNSAKTAQPAYEASTPTGSVKERRSFTKFLSEMMDQMVADFAVAAAAAHPETFILLSEVNSREEQERALPDRRRRAVRADAQPAARDTKQRIASETADRVRPLAIKQHLSTSPAQPRHLKIKDVIDSDARHWESEEVEFPSLIGWLVTAFGSLRLKMQHAREVRQGMAALQSFDDRMLKDIGISRYEIEQAARRGRVRN